MMTEYDRIEKQLAEAGVENYKIVSFSVDPDVDTPEAFQEYLDMFDAQDQTKWEMLMSFTREDIY